MTAHELHTLLTAKKERGALLGQPSDLQSVFVTTREGHTMRRNLEAGAAIIAAGGVLSDFAQIAPLYGFGGYFDACA